MTLPSHLNRTQFHQLLSQYTGNPDIHHSKFQKALKEAGVHKEVMYGARFGREKATKILSVVKEHLESSYKENTYGVRGRGKLFREDPEYAYRQHVRKLVQDDITSQNKARTDAARKQATQAQAQKRAQEARQRLRNVPRPTTPTPSQPVRAKKKDETIVPASQEVRGNLRGAGTVERTRTASTLGIDDPFFAAQGATRSEIPDATPQPSGADSRPPAEKKPVHGMKKDDDEAEEADDAELPDTSAVDRGLPL